MRVLAFYVFCLLPLRAWSCPALVEFLKAISRTSSLSAEEIRVIETFYGRIESKRYWDHTLNRIAEVTGQEVEIPIPIFINGRERILYLFHQFPEGESKNFAALFGMTNVVTVKQFPGSTPHPRLQSQPKMMEYLTKKDISVARIFGAFPEQNLIVREYVNGFSLKNLKDLLKNHEITPGQYKSAVSKLKILQSKLLEIQNSEEFKQWAQAEGIDPDIDLLNINRFVYRNGAWVLIDP